MSIKLSEITIDIDKNDLTVEYKATIKLSNTNSIEVKAFTGMGKGEVANMNNYIARNLKMSILSHVYGDLIDPINVLAIIAAKNCVAPSDLIALENAREDIGKVMVGHDEEVDPSKDVMDQPLIHLV